MRKGHGKSSQQQLDKLSDEWVGIGARICHLIVFQRNDKRLKSAGRPYPHHGGRNARLTLGWSFPYGEGTTHLQLKLSRTKAVLLAKALLEWVEKDKELAHLENLDAVRNR